MALSITSLSESIVSREGGTKITITGSFPQGFTYRVRVDGILAYSGVPGRGAVISPVVGEDVISFVMPPIPLSALGTLTVEAEQLPGGLTDTDTLNVVEKFFGSASFEMRRMFPPWYETGARRLDLEPGE